MLNRLSTHFSRALWLGTLVLSSAAVHAASGFTVTTRQEALVAPGMSAAEVEQALGHPASNMQFRNEPGRTYAYHVMANDPTLFEVDFGADGKVASVNERIDALGTGHGRRH